MDQALSIGVLAERSGTNTPTFRYYEQIGLLKRPDRRESGHRVYGDPDLKRLTFIRRCREFGFPIEQVRSLVDLLENGERSCMEARDVAADHLAAVRSKLDELRALEVSLAKLVGDCDTACAGGRGADCVIQEDLSLARGAGCCPG